MYQNCVEKIPNKFEFQVTFISFILYQCFVLTLLTPQLADVWRSSCIFNWLQNILVILAIPQQNRSFGAFPTKLTGINHSVRFSGKSLIPARYIWMPTRYRNTSPPQLLWLPTELLFEILHKKFEKVSGLIYKCRAGIRLRVNKIQK
jgi:hypothetical protein